MLTQEQISQYNDAGFVVLEGALTTDELARARAAVSELVERSRSVTSTDDVYELEPDHSAEQPRLRRIKTPVFQHPVFNEILRSDRILDAVADLVGPDIRYHGSKLNLKVAGGGTAVEWHQDFAFYPHTNDDILACGIALDDCELDNGCLLVVPGSHRAPMMDHHDGSATFVGAVDATLPEVSARNHVPVVLKAGDMSLHHVRLLHASAPNRSTRQRRLLLIELAAADAFPIQRAIPWDTFDSYLVRGAPATHARLVPIEGLRPPRFGSGAASIFEFQATSQKPGFANQT